MLQKRVVSMKCPGYGTRVGFVPLVLAYSIGQGEIPVFQAVRAQPLKIFKRSKQNHRFCLEIHHRAGLSFHHME